MTEFSNALSIADRIDLVASRMGSAHALIASRSGVSTVPDAIFGFDEFANDIRRRTHVLKDAGVGRGDVVAMLIPLSATSYQTMLAVTALATAQTINYMLEVSAIIALIRASGAVALAAGATFDDDPRAAQKLSEIREALPQLKFFVFGHGPRPDGAIDLDEIGATKPATHWPEEIMNIDPDRVAALFHTSGTTGLPKLVPHTERMWLAAFESCATAQGNLPGDVLLGGLPLFHTSGALQGGAVSLLAGTAIVLPSYRGFRDPAVISNIWNIVETFGVTICGFVPTVAAAAATIKPNRPLHTLRTMLCGGASLPIQIFENLKQITGAALLDGWGMTETCGFSVLNPIGAAKFGTVGLPFHGVEVQIRKVEGTGELSITCGPDEIGELVIRGSIVIKSYFDERPASFTSDGWLRSGDLARIDPDGYVTITGRVKDIIIRGGHNIDPSIIEEPAYRHPAVQLAAAIGRPDRYAGEMPVLYIQLKPGMVAEAEEIREFVQAQVPERAAAPKSVHLVKEMPLTGTGKISKLKLRHEAIRDHFQLELDAILGSGQIVTVAVGDHEKHGTFVTLLEAGPPIAAKHRETIEQHLNQYALKSGWE